MVAGNIATAEAARDLIRAGADALKVGVGRALFVHQSYCRHRCSQITAVYNVSGGTKL